MLANLATKMANLAPFWATVWSILGISGAIFPKISESAKTNDPPSLLLEGWGGRLEPLGQLFWAILATSWPILADVGFKLGPSWQDVGTKMAKMSQESVLVRFWARLGSVFGRQGV